MRNDEEAVLRVLAARDLKDFATGDFTRGQLLGEWRVTDFDPSQDAVVATDGTAVLAYGAVFQPGAIAFVDPAHEGQGIGSAVLAWVERRARELRHNTHRQPVAERNASAHALLTTAGYRPVRSVIQMARALDGTATSPPLPDGIRLEPLDIQRDARALHAADTAAFAGNADFEPGSFEHFRDEHLLSPELDPALSRVAWRGERIAGFMTCTRTGPSTGRIDLLAVDQSERRRGLGTVLLLGGFASFAAAGLHEATLEVASDNPVALRLYERAGMSPRERIDVFEKPELGTGAASAVTAEQ